MTGKAITITIDVSELDQDQLDGFKAALLLALDLSYPSLCKRKSAEVNPVWRSKPRYNASRPNPTGQSS